MHLKLFHFSMRLLSFLLRDADMHSAYLLQQRGWVAGWLGDCHSRYCINTTKSILKLFRPSGGSIIIEAFGTPCADTKFQGELLHRGRLIHGGVGKLAIFDRYCRLPRPNALHQFCTFANLSAKALINADCIQNT